MHFHGGRRGSSSSPAVLTASQTGPYMPLPLVALLMAVSAVGAPRPPRPNVLYMVSDDLRIELPAYGAAHVHAPNIAALANESLVFDAAYCTYSGERIHVLKWA